MKVTLLQSAPVWGDPQASRAALGPVLAGVGETDLIVLPEMFSTGFVTEPEGMAENGLQRDCDTLEWMRQAAVPLSPAAWPCRRKPVSGTGFISCALTAGSAIMTKGIFSPMRVSSVGIRPGKAA